MKAFKKINLKKKFATIISNNVDIISDKIKNNFEQIEKIFEFYKGNKQENVLILYLI